MLFPWWWHLLCINWSIFLFSLVASLRTTLSSSGVSETTSNSPAPIKDTFGHLDYGQGGWIEVSDVPLVLLFVASVVMHRIGLPLSSSLRLCPALSYPSFNTLVTKFPRYWNVHGPTLVCTSFDDSDAVREFLESFDSLYILVPDSMHVLAHSPYLRIPPSIISPINRHVGWQTVKRRVVKRREIGSLRHFVSCSPLQVLLSSDDSSCKINWVVVFL